MKSKRVILLSVALIPLAVGFWPHGHLAITQSCEPQGALASARAYLQGSQFWRQQLQYLDKQVAWILREPIRRAQAQEVGDRLEREADRTMEELYAKYPNLRPSAAEQSADELRHRADAIEQADSDAGMDQILAQRLVELEKCRPVLLSRINMQRK